MFVAPGGELRTSGLNGKTHVFYVPLRLHRDFGLVADLVWVLAAGCARKADSLVLDVKDHIVLPHPCPAEEQLIGPAELLHGDAVLARFVAEEVLRRVPVEALLTRLFLKERHLKAQDWIAQEVVLGSERALLLIIHEADSIWVRIRIVDALAEAVVLRVEEAEPVKVLQDQLKQSLWHIGEGRA